MRLFLLILFCLSYSFSVAQKAGQTPTPHSISKAINSGESIFFIENKGQWSKEILFRTDLKDHSCQVLHNALSFGYLAPPTADQHLQYEVWERSPHENKIAGTRPSLYNGGFVWNLEFVDAGSDVKREQRSFNNGVYHYYRGADPSKWAIDCRRSAELYYTGVWNKTDLRFYGNKQKLLEYDIILHPGSELSKVKFFMNGPVKPRILRDGSMLISTPLGDIKKSRPVAWQVIDGKRIPVHVEFRLSGRELYFKTGTYDRNHDLVIDPLIWSTWVSGSQEDSYVYDLAADASGNTFITGYCNSYTFPTVPGSFNTQYHGDVQDAIVTKVRNDGNGILFTAIFNGTKNDLGYRIFYEYPNVYVAGYTASKDFAVSSNAFQRDGNDGRDIFFAKLSEDGRNLYMSSYLGGSSSEMPYSVFVKGGKMLIGGTTSSFNFPVSQGGVFNNSIMGSSDAFLFCYDTKTNSLDFSRLIGGMSHDYIYGVCAQGNSYYISGQTYSADFPVTTGAYQTTKNGTQDAFVMKLNSSGTSMEYSTFIGGTGLDGCNAMVVENEQVYITGTTNSKDFPTSVGAHKRMVEGDDAYVLKLSARGDKLEYGTLIGTGKTELGVDLIVKNGIVSVAGVTSDGKQFNMTEEIVSPTLFGGQDLFLVMLDAQGSKILYSTVIGGQGNDYLPAIAMNKCNTYVSITSHSPTFPTTMSAFIEEKPNHAEDAMAVFSIELSKFSQPEVNPRKLPSRINICALKKFAKLSTGVLNTYWSTGESDSSITVIKPGVYHAYIYISCDSFYHDSTIIFESNYNFNIGDDVYVCKTPFTRTLSCPLEPCTWSTGEKTPSIQVSKPGIYWVESKNACGIIERDSIEILLDVANIFFRFPPDSLFCKGVSIMLNTGVESKWSDGSKGSQMKVTKPGLYWAEASNKCKETHRDSFHYDLLDKPHFRLCNDTVICSKTFDVEMSTGYQGTKWSTGKTGKTEQAKKPGLYWAEYTDRCGISFRDSFILELDTASLFFSLPPDTVYCGNSLLRTLHSGTERTVWSTGDEGASITVTEPGVYTAVNTNKCGDKYMDHVSLYLLKIPDVRLSGDTVICGTFRMQLDCGSDSASWSDGSEGRYLEANHFGSYRVSYSNICGYSADTMEITHDTTYKELFVPNAFSPDGNFINETFPSPHIPFTDFRISVFTRWGERIYDSDTQWDGRVKGEMAPEGVYLWLINYRDCQGRRMFMSGTFTLLR